MISCGFLKSRRKGLIHPDDPALVAAYEDQVRDGVKCGPPFLGSRSAILGLLSFGDIYPI